MADEESVAGSLFDVETQLEQAIRAYDAAIEGENALLTGWVVVAEWIDRDGDPNLTAFAQERMPWWRIDALLEAGPGAMLYDDDYSDDD